jgi:hypothetical protein
MEPEQSSKRVKLTSSDRISELEVRLGNQQDRKLAIQKERDEATDELKKLGLRMRIHEIERTISEYQVDILRLRKAEELNEMKRQALFIEILEHQMEIAESSLKIFLLKRQEASISGLNVELNLGEKNVTDEISRIKTELAEKRLIMMTKELSIGPSRLTAKYVEAPNEIKEADPTFTTLREAAECYRVSIDAALNRPGSPTRVISPRQASSGGDLGSTEEVTRGVVMSDSTSESPPRQIQLGDIETETIPTTRPQISPKAELPAWLTPLTSANAIQIPVDFKIDADFITLPSDFLAGSGNQLASGGPIVLYKRPACKQQMKFILTEVIQGRKIGNIYGQPGTGKSITTYFTLASHSFTHRILWVACEKLVRRKFNRHTLVPVVIMQNGFKINHEVGYRNLIAGIRKMTESADKTILALDSAGLNTERIGALVAAANNFAEANLKNNKLLYVSSWGTQDDIESQPFHDQEKYAMTFVHGWKLDDYKTAIQNDSFATAVSEYFEFAPNEDRSTKTFLKKIEAKFYFAGHCARYMFAMPISRVKKKIHSAVSKVSNYMDVFKRLVGTSSDIAVHRILSRIDNHQVGNSGVDFVSHYALWKLTEVHGLQSLLALIDTGFGNDDAGLRGCLYELRFFLEVTTSLPFKPDNNTWPIGYVEFNPELFDKTIPTNKWLKSLNPRQSGYDAVILIPGENKEPGIVRFVQITRAKQHSLKLKAYGEFAESVKGVFKRKPAWSNFQVEIYFLIPSHRQEHFTISPVESETALSGFGWPSKKTEIKKKVQYIYTEYE